MKTEDYSVSESDLPEIRPDIVNSTSLLLIQWLRTFWTKIYRDKSFIQCLQGSRAIRYAQLYLDILENVRLLNHKDIPLFHRERWYPIIVKESLKNTGGASRLKLGKSRAVLGPQVEGTEFKEGSVFELGGSVDFDKFVVYALPDKVKAVRSCIVDNIAEPKIVLQDGIDFKISESSIILSRAVDPFEGTAGFAVFDIPETESSPADREAVLWACDTLIDKNFVNDFGGYAVGLSVASEQIYKRLVESVWDATTEGMYPQHLREILAAMCGVPVIKEDSERIESIYDRDESTLVVTDKNIYTLGPGAVLRDNVKAGNTVSKGEFLDKSVRIYPFIKNKEDVPVVTEFSEEQFVKDVSSLSIPRAIVRADIGTGFYVGWDEVDLIFEGLDKNKNPRFSFDVGLDSHDDQLLWSDIWSSFEAENKSMLDCFPDIDVDGDERIGEICGKVSPLEFFLKNLVGANTLIVIVDVDSIPEDAPLYDPTFFQVLRRLIPSYIRLYLVEHGSAINEDEYSPVDDDSAKTSLDCGTFDDEYDIIDDTDDFVDTRYTKICKSRRKDSDDED